MGTWTVRGKFGEEVMANDMGVTVNDRARLSLLADDKDVFDSVYFPPVVEYQSQGFGDQSAAYLNALLYLPQAELVFGIPPFEISGDCIPKQDVQPEDGMMEGKALPTPYRRTRKPGEEIHTGGMVALLPSAETAQNLAVPGGETVEDLHLTLFYMSDVITATASMRDVTRAIIANTIANLFAITTVNATVAGVGEIGEDNAKVYLIGDSFSLPMVYEWIERAMGQDAAKYLQRDFEQRKPWISHVTAGYDGVSLDDLKYRGPVTFDRLRVAFGDTYTDFSFTGGDNLEADTHEWLAQEHGPDAVPVDVALPSLKSLALGDGIPGNIELIMLSITPAEIAADAAQFIYNVSDKSATKCSYCSAKPTKRVLWAEGMAYFNVCDNHVAKAKKEKGDDIVSITEMKDSDTDIETKGKAANWTGDAAALRRYWTKDPRGVAKVRWGVPGDFLRCVSHLRKYVGDAKGLCAVYHKAALGVWPGREKSLGSVIIPNDDVMVELKRLIFADALDHANLSETGNEGDS